MLQRFFQNFPQRFFKEFLQLCNFWMGFWKSCRNILNNSIRNLLHKYSKKFLKKVHVKTFEEILWETFKEINTILREFFEIFLEKFLKEPEQKFSVESQWRLREHIWNIFERKIWRNPGDIYEVPLRISQIYSWKKSSLNPLWNS